MDEAVVVIHDSTVDRTSNGAGPVSRFSLKELKQLDAGGWFHARFSGEKIPTLEEVLDTFKNDVLINIEIKNSDAPSVFSTGLLEKKVAELAKARHAENRVLISSFDSGMLERVQCINHALPVALLVEGGSGNTSFSLCKELHTFSFHPQFEMLNAAMVEQCHSENIFVFPWDVQSEKDIDACFQLGVDGIFVDNPLMAIKRCRQAALD
jgi:glycerophosphoryl diester phosphodiesterase